MGHPIVKGNCTLLLTPKWKCEKRHIFGKALRLLCRNAPQTISDFWRSHQCRRRLNQILSAHFSHSILRCRHLQFILKPADSHSALFLRSHLFFPLSQRDCFSCSDINMRCDTGSVISPALLLQAHEGLSFCFPLQPYNEVATFTKTLLKQENPK